MRNKIIRSAVKSLREFGYPEVNEDNILTDEVYSVFFIAILKDGLGYSKELDTEISRLLEEIKQIPPA